MYGIVGAILTLTVPYLIGFYSTSIETEQSLCPFKMLTGFPCTGCGIIKSIIFFYEGNFMKSIAYHILGPAVVLFCLFTIIVLIFEILLKKEFFNQYLYSKKIAYVLGGFLALYHFSRLVFFVKSHSIQDILKESIWF